MEKLKFNPFEKRKCQPPCYDCRAFSSDYDKIKVEKCLSCRSKAHIESVASKIRNNIHMSNHAKTAENQPIKNNDSGFVIYERNNPHQVFEYTDSHYQQFATSLGFKTELEMWSVLHVDKKLSPYRLKDMIRSKQENNMKISDLTIRKRLIFVGLYRKSKIGRPIKLKYDVNLAM